jgi:hypothetical protein
MRNPPALASVAYTAPTSAVASVLRGKGNGKVEKKEDNRKEREEGKE